MTADTYESVARPPMARITRPQQNAIRSSPVTMTALLSLDLGPSRERQSLTQMLDRGRKNKTQQKQNEQSIKSMYSSGGMPNPFTTMLRQADQLKLGPEPVSYTHLTLPTILRV